MEQLKPWQRVVKTLAEIKPNERASYMKEGLGLVVYDSKHPKLLEQNKVNYQKKLAERRDRTKKYEDIKQKAIEVSRKKHIREYKQSPEFKKLVERLQKKAIESVGKELKEQKKEIKRQEMIAKKQAEILELQKKI